MKKLFLVTLLAFTLTPTASPAAGCKYVIDCYQQALSDLETARARIKESRAEVNALIERASEIEQLIAKYEAASDQTTHALVKLLDTRLTQIEADYANKEAAFVKKLEATADLTESHYQSAKQADEKIQALLKQLNTSAEQVAKLTSAFSVSSDGNVQVKNLAVTGILKTTEPVPVGSRMVNLEVSGTLKTTEPVPVGSRMVYNSVANEEGPKAQGNANTLAFWQIPYKDRFKVKGVADLRLNYYNPTLYQNGPATYIDVVEGLEGKVAILMKASAEGIDPKTMKMINPKFLIGIKGVYDHQFAAGWSSDDYDGDTYGTNCAPRYGKVTQHYGSCWRYNLGADADSPVQDSHWGPHFYSPTAQSLNLKTDGSSYSRVRRITRYVIF